MAGKYPVSPLAPAAFPDLPVIRGASFATIAAGVRYAGRTDVMLARLAPGTTMAGVSAITDCDSVRGRVGTSSLASLKVMAALSIKKMAQQAKSGPRRILAAPL